ncbi:THAP-type domain-containing protein [Aphis craccivora]|uniref:THAP-type domain-containing protein n=1 Tax=Aphis craccivora TaxID=307492 RepID=A0A6G0Y5Z0_APHCR|nr:THAP-type domain-containing protein [Aphis craccivora]
MKITVPCTVQYYSSFDGECTFFSIPKISLSSWTEIIKKINGCETKFKFVCEKHFLLQGRHFNFSIGMQTFESGQLFPPTGHLYILFI